MQERRKAKKNLYKDKEGFTWRPFIREDDELPVPRAPHISKQPHLLPLQAPSPQFTPKQSPQTSKLNGTGLDSLGTPTAPRPPQSVPPRPGSASPPPPPPSLPSLVRADSLRSNHSENSFKTASSDPAINFIPRQTSEFYQQLAVPESAASERKTSVRALQQAQYSALNVQPSAARANSPRPCAPARTQNKNVR